MGMKFLRAGATATEAIEASLRILEDKEITNAGYGSNLSIDGTVECDATIVDHLGRSGACGAVPSMLLFLGFHPILTSFSDIRNPISLAKIILDRSSKPLSLRRVPPNILVGEGARGFAEEHGLVIYSNDHLVSKNARDRFLRWQEDLRRAELKSKESKTGNMNSGCPPCHYDTALSPDTLRRFPQSYSAAVLTGTWNEGQPDTPYLGSPAPEPSQSSDSSMALAATNYFRATGPATPTPRSTRSSPLSLKNGGATSSQRNMPTTPFRSPNPSKTGETNTSDAAVDLPTASKGAMISIDECKPYDSEGRDGSTSPCPRSEPPTFVPKQPDLTVPNDERTQGVKRPFDDDPEELNPQRKNKPYHLGNEDLITDTIGAIAIDEKGRIAAGSSSGGIGMKHRGRLGPAALVGIGTAVIPCSEKDPDDVTVAAVTSGTGEHMATTMASQRCAERIYHGNRRGPTGADIQEDNEDAVIESFITADFMNHPGVKHCHSAGAIGVMVVKKTRAGYYFYFAHNTESFALASMGGLEKEPRCTMSRLSEGGKIAQGARKIRIE